MPKHLQYNGTPYTDLLGERVDTVRPPIPAPEFEPYPPKPDTDRFHRGFGSERAEVLRWGWSVDFGRWGALVRFGDGAEMFTYPA